MVVAAPYWASVAAVWAVAAFGLRAFSGRAAARR